MNSTSRASEIEQEIIRGCEHFDHHGPELRNHTFEIYKRLRETDPVHWAESWGGFWVLTRYEDVSKVARDDINFSAEQDGILQPPMGEKTYPISLDPPKSTRIKYFLTQYFSPKAMEALYPQLRTLTTELVDLFIEKGECDFTEDVGMPLTGIITMRMAGFEESEWPKYTKAMHKIIYNEGTMEELMGYQMLILEGIAAEIERQKTDPRPGLISHLLGLRGKEEIVDDDLILGIVNLLFAGGLDTTQANLGNTLYYFYRNQDHRSLFMSRPDLRMSMVEESLRLMAPQQALCRTVVNDIEIGGKLLRKGERVMMCWAAANRDPAVFDKAEEFVPDREPNRHLTFGVGSHRCLGSNLARQEIVIALEEIFSRLPDYRIDESQTVLAASVGIVYGYAKVPATFTPGKRVLS